MSKQTVINTVVFKDYKEMIQIAQSTFPELTDWCVQEPAGVLTSCLDINQHKVLGIPKKDIPKCQVRDLGYGKNCERDPDFLWLTLLLKKQEGKIKGSRIRYFCSPCLYASGCRALDLLTGAEKLGEIIDGAHTNDHQEVIEFLETIRIPKMKWLESIVDRSGKVLEAKYPNSAELVREIMERHKVK